MLPLASPQLGASREVWVDIDANKWVVIPLALETRRLVRLVAWSSMDKVSAGGFLESPTPRFASGGILPGLELPGIRRSHGRPQSALKVRVDHWLVPALHRVPLLQREAANHRRRAAWTARRGPRRQGQRRRRRRRGQRERRNLHASQPHPRGLARSRLHLHDERRPRHRCRFQ